jgi:chromatin-remodeling ATPase INO80
MDFSVGSILPVGLIKSNQPSVHVASAVGFPQLHEVKVSALAKSCLSRPMMQWCIPPAVAPPIRMICSNRAFMDKDALICGALEDKVALYGVPPSLHNDPASNHLFECQLNLSPPIGLLRSSPSYQTSLSSMQVPDGKRLIYDSAKLARLDLLLQELKAGEHKVLIYFQMTKMMDLMEEYLIYRQYKYLRLDGSSKLEDRRDMVMDWQTRLILLRALTSFSFMCLKARYICLSS